MECLTTEPLQVRTAATVICIRRAPAGAPPPPVLRRGEATGGEEARGAAGRSSTDGSLRLDLVFGGAEAAALHAGWEVLMGQGEVQNWLRSGPGRAEAMRYPGEWKFAGGAAEAGEAPEEAARRELEEEFLVELPREVGACRLHLLGVKQTRPVRNVSYVMHNYVAAAEENAWLARLDAGAANAALAERRARHEASLAAGTFWDLGRAQREAVAPEVRELRWLDMPTAVLGALTSMNDVLTPVNEFQSTEFARLGIVHRDPMFVTMLALLEVEAFPSVQSLARHSAQLEPEAELGRARWLDEGMLPEDVAAAWARRSAAHEARAGAFRTAEERTALRLQREREDEAAVPRAAADA